MEIFAHSDNSYSVEEISYEDMMSLISGQKQISHDLEKEEINSSNTPAENHNDCSLRIAENAKIQLPDWLLSH
ncbi:MAG: hypothetical protein KAI17_10010 [Thiotrichaceae bacterium]|nr:hypothetical protein [Thiotrichaceae bacterium]